MSWRERRAERQEARQANRQDRRDERRMRQEIRQANRTARQGNRAEVRQTAYENGIDPNGWIADSVGHASNAAGQIFGGGKEAAIAEGKTAGNTTTLLYLAGAYMLYKMMKR